MWVPLAPGRHGARFSHIAVHFKLPSGRALVMLGVERSGLRSPDRFGRQWTWVEVDGPGGRSVWRVLNFGMGRVELGCVVFVEAPSGKPGRVSFVMTFCRRCTADTESSL